MTTLRNRLLITLIFVAACTCALGVGVASARMYTLASSRTTATHTTLSLKRPVTAYSGEPDAGSGTAPKTTANPTTGVTTIVLPTGVIVHVVTADWLLRVWAMMTER
jgi:hypothetical protein